MTGNHNSLSSNAKGIPLQKKFDRIREENLKLLKKPLDVESLRAFEEEHYSKIKEMLDYSKVDATSKIIGALNDASALRDENDLKAVNLLKKKKALALREEADKLFKQDTDETEKSQV